MRRTIKRIEDLKTKEDVKEFVLMMFDYIERRGFITGKLEVAQAMFTRGFASGLIAELTALPEEVIIRVKTENLLALADEIAKIEPDKEETNESREG